MYVMYVCMYVYEWSRQRDLFEVRLVHPLLHVESPRLNALVVLQLRQVLDSTRGLVCTECMYVCMYICMYVLYVCIQGWRWVDKYRNYRRLDTDYFQRWLYKIVYSVMYVCMYVCMYVYINRMYVYMYVCMHVIIITPVASMVAATYSNGVFSTSFFSSASAAAGRSTYIHTHTYSTYI